MKYRLIEPLTKQVLSTVTIGNVGDGKNKIITHADSDLNKPFETDDYWEAESIAVLTNYKVVKVVDD